MRVGGQARSYSFSLQCAFVVYPSLVTSSSSIVSFHASIKSKYNRSSLSPVVSQSTSSAKYLSLVASILLSTSNASLLSIARYLQFLICEKVVFRFLIVCKLDEV